MIKIDERLIMIFLNPPRVRPLRSFYCKHCKKTCMVFRVEEREKEFLKTHYKAFSEPAEDIFCPYCGKK